MMKKSGKESAKPNSDNTFFLGSLHFFFSKKKGSKGQAQFVMHALGVAFSLVMIIIIISIMNSITDDHREFVAKREILQACDIMKTGVEKIMVPQEYVSRMNTTLGRVFVAMPERIGDIKYSTYFANATLIIETIGTPSINDTCAIGFNATFKGGTNGGKTEITRFRYNNGTEEIRVAGA